MITFAIFLTPHDLLNQINSISILDIKAIALPHLVQFAVTCEKTEQISNYSKTPQQAENVEVSNEPGICSTKAMHSFLKQKA